MINLTGITLCIKYALRWDNFATPETQAWLRAGISRLAEICRLAGTFFWPVYMIQPSRDIRLGGVPRLDEIFAYLHV